MTPALGADAALKLLRGSELSAMALPPPAKRITCGSSPQQFGELRLPIGAGPFPVVVLVHGGCWLAKFNDVCVTRMAAWLAQRGVATWTIEFRRGGDDGCGWAGTFLDVGNAIDDLRSIATHEPIDLNRVYPAGHSAGGHLALWFATRSRLPEDSEIYPPDPLLIRGFFGLAAVTDLYGYRRGPSDSCHATVDPLVVGRRQNMRVDMHRLSPRQLLPLGVPQAFIQDDHDRIGDPAPDRAYVDAARNAGDRVEWVTLPNAGHFEASVALPQAEAAFEKALRWPRARQPGQNDSVPFSERTHTPKEWLLAWYMAASAARR